MIILAILPSKMFALSSIVTPRRIHTASGLALSFSRGCFILGISIVGEPVGKVIGIGQLVHRCRGGFDSLPIPGNVWEGGASSERNLPRYSCRHQHGCGSFVR